MRMKKVKLVGILNLTPDSFCGDGIHDCAPRAVTRAAELFAAGADLIDIGGEATNPWSEPISLDEEWHRLEPVLAKLLAVYPGKISLDTHHPETVLRTVASFNDKFIVNDVTGMNDPNMRTVTAKLGLRCIISHLPARFGTDIPKAHANADVDDTKQVLARLLERRSQLIDLGLPSEKIVLDPGIGFGKTMRLNWDLLQFGELVRKTGIPNEVMVGYSRKRFLGEHRFELESNLEAARIAVKAGATYLRVHDVASHRKLLQAIGTA